MGNSKVWLIARRELVSYFGTWMGYVIAASALFIDGLLFNAYAMGKAPRLSADVLREFFYYSSGISMVAGVFLSMRLLAEEKQTGTLVLFYTSPVTERQLIYGKFFSAALFLLFLHIISIYIPALIFVNGKVSLGHLASGYLGVTLLGSATIAMTLFASVVSPNQLVAGILGAVFVVTALVLWILSEVVGPPFKELFTYLALHNMHFDSFRDGIIHIRDIVYYFSVIFFFLECSVRALQSRRWQG